MARWAAAALHAVGRLAAEYTLVSYTFLPPLDPGVLAAHLGRRVQRLDSESDDFSRTRG
ncbi:hypothetical protein Psi02_62640 [Planotetraspora silvatica]|uniref:Uncharacterized protein n=1 Tax=Planotetraspora silvatica TaxID=234614 RepID=A0A8J3USB1_9ACTN|nr:hypothetical protein [Planotetraspora silvatica]GII49840.1 hypothetical protein Psi02_62640 [Planotetraspora silvatica]